MVWIRRNKLPEAAGVSQRTADSWLRSGLRHVKVGGTVLVRGDWLDTFLQSHEVTSDQVSEVVDSVCRELRG